MKKALILTSLIGFVLQANADFYDPVPAKKAKTSARKMAGTTKKSPNVVIGSARSTPKKVMAGSIKPTQKPVAKSAMTKVTMAPTAKTNATKPVAATTTRAMAPAKTNNAMVNSFSAPTPVATAPAHAAATSSTMTSAPVTTSPAAQTQTQSMKLPATPATEKAKGPWKFSGIASITREAQMKNQVDDKGNETRSESLGFEVIPRIAYDKYSAALWLTYSKDLKDPEGSDWGDPILILTRSPWDMGKYFKYQLTGIGLIPLSKTSREVTEFKGGAGLDNKFILNTEAIGAKGLMMSLKLGGTYLFNEATTNVKGDPLNQYSITQKFDVGYEIGSWSISAFFYHYSRFSYENVVREYVWHGLETGWAFNKNFNVAIGMHNSNAPLYKAPTYDFNLKFTDDEATMIYGKLGLAW